MTTKSEKRIIECPFCHKELKGGIRATKVPRHSKPRPPIYHMPRVRLSNRGMTFEAIR